METKRQNEEYLLSLELSNKELRAELDKSDKRITRLEEFLKQLIKLCPDSDIEYMCRGMLEKGEEWV